MSVKKVIFKNFTNVGNYNGKGDFGYLNGVRFYNSPTSFLPIGTISSDTRLSGVASNMSITSTNIYYANTDTSDARWSVLKGFNTNEPQAPQGSPDFEPGWGAWCTWSGATTHTVTFTNPIPLLFKVEFCNFAYTRTYGGFTAVTIEFYDEYNILLKSERLTGLTEVTDVKTLSTPDLSYTYPLDIQEIVTLPVNTSGKYTITSITIVDSTTTNSIVLNDNMNDGGVLGTKQLWTFPVNKHATKMEVI
jgi:hypothetical protein